MLGYRRVMRNWRDMRAEQEKCEAVRVRLLEGISAPDSRLLLSVSYNKELLLNEVLRVVKSTAEVEAGQTSAEVEEMSAEGLQVLRCRMFSAAYRRLGRESNEQCFTPLRLNAYVYYKSPSCPLLSGVHRRALNVTRRASSCKALRATRTYGRT